jgi:hypothetical protein
MPSLPPDDHTDPVILADWWEISALTSPNRHASRTQLEDELSMPSFYELSDTNPDQDKIEEKILEVVDEIEERGRFAKQAYPFKFSYPGTLGLRTGTWEDCAAYVFCLCLSFEPLDETKLPPRLFEEMSSKAAAQYLGGDMMAFGWPRHELPKQFPKAVDQLCALLGEGDGRSDLASFEDKDGALDLVVWKEFADRRRSKVVMFGQCAAGRNWEEKLRDLDPGAFWEKWVRGRRVSRDSVRAFFTPYRIADDRTWPKSAVDGGVLFDRCRISYWAQQEQGSPYQEQVSWARGKLRQLAD